ncbi:MAG TPA: dipeptidyl carboxypeptidase II, partial [Stellaceae bacterium]|nr:dipeptidyl carboxypeptidase II [Stellaceae bacterium]
MRPVPRVAQRPLCGLLLTTSALTLVAAAPAPEAANPLATPSTLPYEAPRFDQIKDADFKPAIEAGMTQENDDYRAIAENPAPPDFDNTIVAMERAGQLLASANLLFQNIVSANSDDTLNALNTEEAPRLQAHTDEILLNPKLFARVKTLYDARDRLPLDSDKKFLLTRYYTRFVRAGAELKPADQTKLRDINKKIAGLSAQYHAKLLKATDDAAVVVGDKEELAGLSDAQIAAAADAAKARKLDGKYVLVLRNTTQQPILASLQNRALRLRVL